ncbi:MAG: [FeFe] hydrogenase H-cluster radical SAM maturase HydE [Calditrichia bacterium]
MKEQIINKLESFLEHDNQLLDKEDLAYILRSDDLDMVKALKQAAEAVRLRHVGREVYYRGLIEISNYCRKDCYYCGIRKSNREVERYLMDPEDVKKSIDLAVSSQMSSIVIQSGENLSPAFLNYLRSILLYVKDNYDGQLRITLSLGELSEKVLKELFELGARRYLLRIEVSDPDLYYNYHPKDSVHSYEERLNCLKTLKKLGYQVGTGVMIGLPGQTEDNLADDLLFMKSFDVDMVGMGPYIEHHSTPLPGMNLPKWPVEKRLDMSYKMIALLRLLMKDINIAATTALQTLDPLGREKGIAFGANVVMPNLSDEKYRDKYFLYDNKPCVDDQPTHCVFCLAHRVKSVNYEVAFGKFGDSLHYQKRMNL